MTNDEEERTKLTNTQLNKLKFPARNKTVTIVNKQKFKDKELLHELFLTTKQKNKIRNAFSNKISQFFYLEAVYLD